MAGRVTALLRSRRRPVETRRAPRHETAAQADACSLPQEGVYRFVRIAGSIRDGVDERVELLAFRHRAGPFEQALGDEAANLVSQPFPPALDHTSARLQELAVRTDV